MTGPITGSWCPVDSRPAAGQLPRRDGAVRPAVVPAVVPAPISGTLFRSVMGSVPTSVAVVAGMTAGGEPVGLAIGTLTSVSLDPPLIAFCPGATSTSWPKIRATGRFCVSVLAGDQQDVCAVFASKRPDKFAGLSWSVAGNGAPRLDDVVAWLECDLEAEHAAGDHSIAIGRVTRLGSGTGEVPLVFLGGRYVGVA
ncbi:monooxygenase [Sphaerisporangium rufum]|uniref:Monooxygenase n=1 Tax=Sphaerisporangium rufum TaxID=1381558 RepID=A0A919V0A0_9ACTN|nr:flavin reductase family protein [Sphaerisporangium rufum]GII78554.1 monooxygenase [Sphaerisporangium rufum]